MKNTVIWLTLITLSLFGGTVQAEDHRLGGGINYWTTVDNIDLDKDYDENGISYLVSYQYWPALLGLELDVEFLPDRFGESAVAPAAYLLAGKALYAAAGVGLTYSDGNFAKEPFFALRAGLNLEILPGIIADIYANYRFNDSTELEGEETDIDTDTVFLGAALRFAY